MLNTSPINLIGAAFMMALAVIFGTSMNTVGQYTTPQAWEIRFQSEMVFAPTEVYRTIVDDVVWRFEKNPEYVVVINAHQSPDLPDGTGLAWAEQLKTTMVNHGVDPASILVSDHGSSMAPERGAHETHALWEKRLNRVVVEMQWGN